MWNTYICGIIGLSLYINFYTFISFFDVTWYLNWKLFYFPDKLLLFTIMQQSLLLLNLGAGVLESMLSKSNLTMAAFISYPFTFNLCYHALDASLANSIQLNCVFFTYSVNVSLLIVKFSAFIFITIIDISGSTSTFLFCASFPFILLL